MAALSLWGCEIAVSIRGWAGRTPSERTRNMHHKHIAVAAATALAVAATPALAEEQGPAPAKTAKPLSSAVVAKDKASAKLKVRYSCKSGETLWISLKQSKNGKKDPDLKKEGSSQVAAALWQ